MAEKPSQRGRSARRQRRTDRLRERKAARERRALTVVLYVLAAVMAFAAVVGASVLARRLVSHKPAAITQGYVALLTVGVGESDRQPVSYLVVENALLKKPFVFAVPRSLLLTGPAGEYVMAGDAMALPEFPADVARLINAPVSFEVRLDYASFVKLLPAGDLPVIVDNPASLMLGGALRTYDKRFSLTSADLPQVLSAVGKSGVDEATMQVGILSALVQVAALQPAAQRQTLVAAADQRLSGAALTNAGRLLSDLLTGNVPVALVPAQGTVADGQFAYRPDRQQIMAQITRRTPGFTAQFTVQIRNGTGEAGVGEAVARRLATLSVNLASPVNADNFDYGRTQIVAGADAVGLAQDIRAILGHGVVLGDNSLSPTTIVITIGKDITTKDLQ
jgi:hypothetical protein